MELLKLGLVGLPPAEASLIATLFRLHKVEPSFIWTLATMPPFDALLVDAECEEALFLPLKGAGTRVARLGADANGASDRLSRPIRSDLLVRWLNAIEVEILHGGQDQFSSTLSTSKASHKGDEPMQTRPPPVTRPAEVLAPAPTVATGARTFKLRRWPSQELLKGDVNRIRMATLLSRRPLQVAELVSLSRVPESRCVAFVDALLNARLVDSTDLPAPNGAGALGRSPAAPSRPAVAPPKARGVGASLIASIRKRFGIG